MEMDRGVYGAYTLWGIPLLWGMPLLLRGVPYLDPILPEQGCQAECPITNHFALVVPDLVGDSAPFRQFRLYSSVSVGEVFDHRT